MKVNKEEAKQYLEKIVPIIQAVAEGKIVQHKGYSCEWKDYAQDDFLDPDDLTIERRIKPEPKLRPWKFDEVPVGALLEKSSGEQASAVILCADAKDVFLFTKHGLMSLTFQSCLECRKWKWPQEPDTAWKQCGVSE